MIKYFVNYFILFCSNIQHMRKQFDALGLSFTWERVRFSFLRDAALFYCMMEHRKPWNFTILFMTIYNSLKVTSLSC